MMNNTKMSRPEQLNKVQKEAYDLFCKKNQDYGDAFATYGPVGVIVRIGDKINRLHSITKNGIAVVNTESIRDTLIDLHNYAAMAIMLLDEKKEKKIIHPRIQEIKVTNIYSETTYPKNIRAPFSP